MSDEEQQETEQEEPLNRAQRRAAKKNAGKSPKHSTHQPIEDLRNAKKAAHPSSKQPNHGSVRTTGSQRGG